MKGKIRNFILGFLISALIFTMALTVLAKTGQEAWNVTFRDIKLYVDGVLITPKDANGNIVEPFIYNGTTYLPVRALSEALNKRVTWDGTTSSVVVGIMPGEVVYFDDILQPYQTECKYWQTAASDGRFITIAGNKYYHGVGHDDYDWNDAVGYYNLNAQYSQLSGMYGKYDGQIKNGSIEFYGDGRLIKTLEIKAGDMPKDFSVDLNGVLQLKIVLKIKGTSIVNWQIK